MPIFSQALVGMVAPLVLAAAPPTDSSVAHILDANRVATSSQQCARQRTLHQTFRIPGADMPATLESFVDRHSGSFANWSRTGPVLTGEGFDGIVAWQRDVSGTVRPQAGGEKAALAISQAYREANRWWASDRGGATISSAGPVVDGGRTYDRLTVLPAHGQKFTAWFEVDSHRLDRVTEQAGAVTTTTSYSDYRPVEGCLIAHAMMIDGGDGEEYRETYVSIRTTLHIRATARRFSPPRSNPRDFSFAQSGRTTVPFRLVGNHVLVDARINGRGPFTIILDTGGQTVLTPATAESLAVAALGNRAVGGIGAGVENSGSAQGLDIVIGGFTFKHQSALVMELPSSPPPARPLQGMLGYELLRRVVVEVNYETSILTLSDPRVFNPANAGIAVPFAYSDHMPEVAGSFEGVPGRFRVDTGSGSELVVSSPFVEEHRIRDRHPRGVERVSSGGGVGGVTSGYITRSDDLKLGPISLDHFVTELSAQKAGAFADPSYAANVGSRLLKRFVVTFDYPRQTIYFRPRTDTVADTGTYDRTGLSLESVSNGIQVAAVAPSGPASRAGVQAGDILYAVDGSTSAAADLIALRYQFRNTPVGTPVSIEILRDGSRIITTVLPKDQI